MASGPWAADFSDAYFRRLLAAIRSAWRPRLFCNAAAVLRLPEKSLFLRHDVDVSPERALAMAAIEHEEGVASTYMVMNRARLYSLRTSESVRVLRQIAGLGHEIGLHFDYPDPYRTSQGVQPERLDAEIQAACAELEEALGAPVASLSFHRPVPSVIRGPLMIAGRVNAYAAELMDRYISDSKGSWREGEPLPVIQEATTVRTLQVLIHPIWWGERHRTAQERLDDFSEERALQLGPAARPQIDADLAASLPGVTRTHNAA